MAFGNGPWTTPPTTPQVESSPVITISVGEVNFTDTDARVVEEAQANSIIDDYTVFSHYEKDRRTYQIPLSSPGDIDGDTVAFVALSRTTLLWVVDWTVQSSRAKPKAPAKSSNNRFIWLDEWLEPAQIGLGPDGETPVYRLSGTYFYGCRNPSAELREDISFPLPPWIQDVFSRTMNQGDFIPGVTDPNQGGNQEGLQDMFIVKGG